MMTIILVNDVQRGDLNNDSHVNILDVRLLLQEYINSTGTWLDDELLLNQKRIDRLEISPYEMIEQVAYLAMGDVYVAYDYLFANKKILSSVVSYMMQERYISELKDVLDNFSGIVNNNDISTETRYAFYNAYVKIDDSFAEIKKNNPDYIK